MQEKFTLDICLSPNLVSNYNLDNTIIVIIDIIRAGSTICTALSYGVDHIVALDDIETALQYKEKGYLIAGERNGDKLEGFDYGNSPVGFMDRKLEGKMLAITTTNGTATFQMALNAASTCKDVEILIGAYVNYSKLYNYLNMSRKNILLVCSGWYTNPCIEDTLFAGRLAHNLDYTNRYNFLSDSVAHTLLIHQMAGKNIFDFIMDNSVRFSQGIGQLGTDIRYCLKEDVANVLPIFSNGKIICKTL